MTTVQDIALYWVGVILLSLIMQTLLQIERKRVIGILSLVLILLFFCQGSNIKPRGVEIALAAVHRPERISHALVWHTINIM